MSERAQQLLLELADDELVLGWRDSEWTGIAPLLEEDVAFSSIAQNEIGHARALYELAARELGTTADELAFDRAPDEYRCAPLVELRSCPTGRRRSRAASSTRQADAIRLEALRRSDDAEVAGLAAKIDREEAYHRMHAEMWADRLRDEPRFEAVDELCRTRSAARASCAALVDGRAADAAVERGTHDELAELWEEMTMVRRSQPAGATW